jgi:hypothetical protein
MSNFEGARTPKTTGAAGHPVFDRAKAAAVTHSHVLWLPPAAKFCSINFLHCSLLTSFRSLQTKKCWRPHGGLRVGKTWKSVRSTGTENDPATGLTGSRMINGTANSASEGNEPATGSLENVHFANPDGDRSRDERKQSVDHEIRGDKHKERDFPNAGHASSDDSKHGPLICSE